MALVTENLIINNVWQQVAPTAASKLALESLDNDGFQFAYSPTTPADTLQGHAGNNGSIISSNVASGDILWVRTSNATQNVKATVSYE